MKHLKLACFFAAWVAATLVLGQEGDNQYLLGFNELGEAIYGNLQDYQRELNLKRTQIDAIANAAQRQKEKIDTLWEESQRLVDGLTKTQETWNKALYADDGIVNTMVKWIEWLNAFEDKWDGKEPPEDQDLSSYAKKSVTDNHERRISALERGGTGGGGGCDDDCPSNFAAIKNFFGDHATYAPGSATGDGKAHGCGTLSFGSTFLGVLNGLTLAYCGDTLAEGSPVKVLDGDGKPAFAPASGWVGDGLALTEDAAALAVKVTEEAKGTLSQTLDGTAVGQDVSGVAAIDAEGHVRRLAVGTLTVAADGTTIERSAETEGESPRLRVKTSGIVDGKTIKVDGDGRVARVDVSALCDGDTIAVDGEGRLYAKNAAGLTVNGSDGSSAQGNTVRFEAEAGCNVQSKVTTGDDGAIVVKIGVYYQ